VLCWASCASSGSSAMVLCSVLELRRPSRPPETRAVEERYFLTADWELTMRSPS